MSEFRTRRRIEFSDTDAGGTVHFSRFFAFMETAEDEYLRSLGVTFTTPLEGRNMGWPKVAASCEYKHPLRYGDDLEIHLRVARVGTKSITYEFRFQVGEIEVARGRTTSVCCLEKPDGVYEGIPIPEFLAAKIEEAPRCV